MRIVLGAAALLLAWSSVILAQDAKPMRSGAPPEPADTPKPLPAGHSLHGEAFNEGPRQKAYLMSHTGDVHFPVTTSSPDAQRFIDQGVGQLHGFWYFESERSFRQAAQLDPQCAIAYWGMAMSNINNGNRAKAFIAKAVERQPQASRRERLWIESLNTFLTSKSDERSRHQKYIRDLENILHEFPDDLEAKAFLCVELWQASQRGVSMNSRQAVDALLDQIFDKTPLHPAHHYRIHLWDDEKAKRALGSAARCGQSAPSIAHMWHMSGHIYSKMHRYADAVWEQEAAARVDHAHMIRDRVLPHQIHNYAHNNEWCARNLTYVGRIHDAVTLVKNLIELPQHPKHNVATNGSHAAGYGRQRLMEFLLQFELWDEILALADTPYLDPTDQPEQQVRRIRLIGAARFGKQQFDLGQQQIEELKTRLRTVDEKIAKDEQTAEEKAKKDKKKQPDIDKAKADARRKHDSDKRRINEPLEQLRGYRALARGDHKLALQHFGRGGNVSKELRARIQAAAGDFNEARRLAKEAVDAAPGQAAPLVTYVDVLHRSGETDKAATLLLDLQTLAVRADLDVPVFQRITPFAKALDLPNDWRVTPPPASDLGQRPDIATLGPFRWRPYPAEPWTVVDGQGKTHALQDFRGRPVIVIFYLGYGCLHCVQQLNAFAPKTSEFQQLGVSLLAVSTDPPPELKTSLEKCELPGGFPFPLASDSEMHLFKAYRAFDDFEQKPLHGTFLIDGAGLVRWHDISHEPFNDPAFLLKEAKRLLAVPAM